MCQAWPKRGDGPHGRGGRCGRGGQQGGVEAPMEDIAQRIPSDQGEEHDAGNNMPTFKLLSLRTLLFS